MAKQLKQLSHKFLANRLYGVIAILLTVFSIFVWAAEPTPPANTTTNNNQPVEVCTQQGEITGRTRTEYRCANDTYVPTVASNDIIVTNGTKTLLYPDGHYGDSDSVPYTVVATAVSPTAPVFVEAGKSYDFSISASAEAEKPCDDIDSKVVGTITVEGVAVTLPKKGSMCAISSCSPLVISPSLTHPARDLEWQIISNNCGVRFDPSPGTGTTATLVGNDVGGTCVVEVKDAELGCSDTMEVSVVKIDSISADKDEMLYDEDLTLTAKTTPENAPLPSGMPIWQYRFKGEGGDYPSTWKRLGSGGKTQPVSIKTPGIFTFRAICREETDGTAVGASNTVEVIAYPKFNSLTQRKIPTTHKYLKGTKQVRVLANLEPQNTPKPTFRFDLWDVENEKVVATETTTDRGHSFSISNPARYTIKVAQIVRDEDVLTAETDQFVYFSAEASASAVAVNWEDIPVAKQLEIFKELATQGKDAGKLAVDLGHSMISTASSIEAAANKLIEIDWQKSIVTFTDKIVAIEKTIQVDQAKAAILTPKVEKARQVLDSLLGQTRKLEGILENNPDNLSQVQLDAVRRELKAVLSHIVKRQAAWEKLSKKLGKLLGAIDNGIVQVKGLRICKSGVLNCILNAKAAIAAKSTTILPKFQRVGEFVQDSKVLFTRGEGIVGKALKFPILDMVIFYKECVEYDDMVKKFAENKAKAEQLAKEYKRLTGNHTVSRKKPTLDVPLTITTVPGDVNFRLKESSVTWVTKDNDLKPVNEGDTSDFVHLVHPDNGVSAYSGIQSTSSGKTGTIDYSMSFLGNLGRSKVNITEEIEDVKILSIRANSSGLTEETAVSIGEGIFSEANEDWELTKKNLSKASSAISALLGLLIFVTASATVAATAGIAVAVIAVASIIWALFDPKIPAIQSIIDSYPSSSGVSQ